jgi:hypothetical protein
MKMRAYHLLSALLVALAAASIGIGCLVSSARGGSLYAVQGDGNLGLIDTATAVYTPIGNLNGGFTPSGLAIVDGGLYTTDFGGTQVYSINPDTAQSTPTANAAMPDGQVFYTIGSSSAGMFAGDVNYVGTYKVNPVTGAVQTLPGTFPGGSFTTFGNSLGSELYFLGGDTLYTLNATTGVYTPIGQTGIETNLQDGNGWFGIAVSGNTLYGMYDTFDNHNTLYSLNTTTGAATLIGEVTGAPTQIYGIAPVAVPVPEPATCTVALAAAAGLGVIGLMHRLRRARKGVTTDVYQ